MRNDYAGPGRLARTAWDSIRAMTILMKREVWRKPRLVTATRHSSDLTLEEQANVRTVILFLAKRYGSYRKLAVAMGANQTTLRVCSTASRNSSIETSSSRGEVIESTRKRRPPASFGR